MSRHALPPEARASHAVGVKLTPPEWDLLNTEAIKQGVAPAHLARDLAMAALRALRDPPSAVEPAPIWVAPAVPVAVVATEDWTNDASVSNWYSVNKLKTSETDYRHGDKVLVDVETNGIHIPGSIVGFASKNLADYWIVKFDSGVYSDEYPYSCAAVVHTMIKLK